MKNKTGWKQFYLLWGAIKAKWSARKAAVKLRHDTTKRGGVNPNRGKWRYLNRLEPVPKNAQVACRFWRWDFRGRNTHWLAVRRFPSVIGRQFLTVSRDIRVPRD